jgi:hypothetical protein
MGFFPLRSEGVQPFSGTKTVIGFPGIHQFLGVFFVQSKPLGLDIGSKGSPNIRTFIPMESKPCEGIVEILHKSLIESSTVCIFQPEDKGSP